MTPASAAPWHWLNPEVARVEEEQRNLRAALEGLPPAPVPQTLECVGFHSGLAFRPDSVRWVQLDLNQEYPLDAVVIVPAYLRAEVYGWPRRFRVDASTQEDFGECVTLVDQTSSDTEPVMLPHYAAAHGVKARYVRLTATALAPQPRLKGSSIFCLGELLVFSGGRNVALHCAVAAPGAVETLPTWSPRHLVDGWSALGLPVLPDNERANGWHSLPVRSPDAACWVQVDLGVSRTLQEIRLIPAHPSDFPDRFGFGFPKRFKVEASGDPRFSDPQTVFDATQQDFPNPGDNVVALPVANLHARCLRVTATRLFERTRDYVLRLQSWKHSRVGKMWRAAAR